MLGLHKNYRISFDRIKDGKDFSYPIENWKPNHIVDFIIMSLIARSDWDLLAIEKMEVTEYDKEIDKLVTLIEEYANRGFDIIKSKMDTNIDFFNSDFAMINFLKEVTEKNL